MSAYRFYEAAIMLMHFLQQTLLCIGEIRRHVNDDHWASVRQEECKQRCVNCRC